MRFFIDSLYLSPYTYTVLSALREKSIAFELIEVSFEGNKSLTPTFQAKTMTDLIPLLEDGNFTLSESLAILEYLEDKYPRNPMYPDSIEKRAQARMLLSWYRCGLQALRKERSTETVFYPGQLKLDGPLSTEARDETEEWMRFLNTLRKPGEKFLFENRWTIADTETALMLQRLIRNGEKLDSDWKEYAHRMWERPSMKEFVEKKRAPFRSYYR